MLIFVIDDELPMLRDDERVIREAAPQAELACFDLAADALAAIRQQGARPDVVFTDIEMPGISGLELAVTLKTVSPDTRVVFVTGYSGYAVEAFRIKAQGYLLKPLRAEDVRDELSYLPPPQEPTPEKLRVQCFGSFEVFWQGEPLKFERRQSKELLAYLVDRRGASCSSEEIIAALWEEDGELKNAKQRVRNFIGDLKATLKRIGMEDVLIRRGSSVAIRRELLDCDYYRMLAGDMAAVNAFRGEYMTNYSWAELTAGTLYFRREKRQESQFAGA